ncbi:MAG: GNAT family N-acetyltransferase [Stappiaceae bacterium]
MAPSFTTSRLLLRPRSLLDLEDCLAMDKDPLVTKFIPGPWADAVKHRTFVLARMRTIYPEGLGYWTVRENNAGQAFVGWVLLLPHDSVAGEIEIGWRFIRQKWGQGFATEAAAAVLNYGIKTLGLKRIVADIDPENTPSIKVAEKIGMQFTEHRNHDGWPARSYQIRLCEEPPTAPQNRFGS